MATLPSQVWIKAQGKEPPEWVVSYMVNGDIAADGSFELDTPDGAAKVNLGDAIFVFDGNAYVCPPKLMQEKLASIATVEVAAPQLTPVHQEAYRLAPSAKSLKFKPVIGSPPAPQFAAVTDLFVDDSYQRSIEGGASQKLIEKIAVGWDWRLCLPLLVSRRAGKLFVIDGQHRLEGARMRGDINHMPIVVFDLDDQKAEAELFVQANRARRPMQKLDEFHAAVAAGDTAACAIVSVVEEAGLQVGRSQAWQMLKPNEVIFVQTIGRYIKSHSREIAVAALRTIAEAFKDQTLIGGSPLFEGICALLKDGLPDGSPTDLSLLQIVLHEVGIPGWKEAVAGAENSEDRREMMLRAMRAAYDEARAQ